MTENFDADGYKRTGQLLEPTREQLVRIWWTFWWPAALWTIAEKIVGNYVHGGDSTVFSAQYHRSFSYDMLTLVLGFAISVWASWRAFNREYPGFKPILISHREQKPTRVLVGSLNALRVWWAVLWRSLMWSLVFSLFVLVPVFFKNLTTPYWGLSLPGWLYMNALLEAGMTYFILQRYIVEHRFGDFEVRLLALAHPSQANAAAPASSV